MYSRNSSSCPSAMWSAQGPIARVSEAWGRGQTRAPKAGRTEEAEVLRELAHVAHVRDDPQPELLRHHRARDGLADAAQPRRVDLADLHCARRHEVLEHHAVGNRLSDGDGCRGNRLGDRSVRRDVVRVRRLLDEQRRHDIREQADDLLGLLNRPL